MRETEAGCPEGHSDTSSALLWATVHPSAYLDRKPEGEGRAKMQGTQAPSKGSREPLSLWWQCLVGQLEFSETRALFPGRAPSTRYLPSNLHSCPTVL